MLVSQFPYHLFSSEPINPVYNERFNLVTIKRELQIRNTIFKLFMHSMYSLFKVDTISERIFLKTIYFYLLENLWNDYKLPNLIETIKRGSLWKIN